MLDTPMGPVNVGFRLQSRRRHADRFDHRTPDGAELPIKNGKVDGDKITFTVDLDFGGMALTLDYTGVVSADQIKMTCDFMGMPFDFVCEKGPVRSRSGGTMRSRSVRSAGALAALWLFSAAAPVLAHHSFAMFDHTRTMTLKGEVTKFQWTNPHALLELDVPEPAGSGTSRSS